MSERDVVLIVHKVPQGGCADSEFQSYILTETAGTGVSNFIFREGSNSVSCSTYGKEAALDDNGGCMVVYVNSGNTTCFIGFDGPNTIANISDNLAGINVLVENYQ